MIREIFLRERLSWKGSRKNLSPQSAMIVMLTGDPKSKYGSRSFETVIYPAFYKSIILPARG
jgi:hypothetical protein